FGCCCGRQRLLLIATRTIRHFASRSVHRRRRAIERFDDIRYCVLKFPRGAFDKLTAGFERAGLVALFATRICRVRGCLPEEQEGPAHFSYFIAASVLDVDIEIAIGNAAHGVAEKT